MPKSSGNVTGLMERSMGKFGHQINQIPSAKG